MPVLLLVEYIETTTGTKNSFRKAFDVQKDSSGIRRPPKVFHILHWGDFLHGWWRRVVDQVHCQWTIVHGRKISTFRRGEACGASPQLSTGSGHCGLSIVRTRQVAAVDIVPSPRRELAHAKAGSTYAGVTTLLLPPLRQRARARCCAPTIPSTSTKAAATPAACHHIIPRSAHAAYRRHNVITSAACVQGEALWGSGLEQSAGTRKPGWRI
jgi:hypothetical protein